VSPGLLLPDPASAADLGMLVARARRVDPDGAIRLVGRGEVLAGFVCVVGPPGPTVLGLRTLRLAAPADLDVTVPLSAVADRCSRIAAERSTATRPGPVDLALPPIRVSPAWAGISPPREGWQPVGGVAVQTLLAAARQGAAQIAAGSPEGSGAVAVARLRGLVWGRPLLADGDPGLPAGMAFAADLLGFVRPGDDDLPVHRSGRWSRLSSPRGYLLARPPATL
jgi:hypothetical protein